MTGPSRGRKVALLVMLFVLTLAAAGCTSGSSESAEAELAVRAYTEALVPALAAETLDPLRAYATPEQVDRVRLYVVKLTQEDRVRVEARLVSLEVSSIEVEGDQATVETVEQWTFLERRTDSTDDTSRDDYEGEVTYSLVRAEDANSWLVSDVETQLTP